MSNTAIWAHYDDAASGLLERRLRCTSDGDLNVNSVGPSINETWDATQVIQGPFDYETVAASQTDQVLGVTGAVGDFLHKLVIVVTTAATAAVSIKDGGGSTISVLPNSPGGGIGVYEVELNIRSSDGAWKVTTGAGSSVIGVGIFTP